jgi:hypothetical protein
MTDIDKVSVVVVVAFFFVALITSCNKEERIQKPHNTNEMFQLPEKRIGSGIR